MTAPGVGVLLRAALVIYRRNVRLVLAVTLPIVVVVTGLTALGLGELTAHYKAVPQRDFYVELAATELVTVPLISAILARFVVADRRREPINAADLVASALEVFPAVLLVIVAWLAAVFIGSSLFAIPGIYILVSWYFVVQAVVIDGDRGLAPISRSAALVRGHWWQSAIVGLGFQIAAVPAQALIVLIFDGLAQSANSYAIVAAGTAIGNAVTLPFLAIGATLYYLALREQAASRPGG